MNVPMSVDAPAGCQWVSEVLNQVGDKWTVQVVVALRDWPRRFNDIKRQVAGISQQMLTRTLKTLERDGLVDRGWPLAFRDGTAARGMGGCASRNHPCKPAAIRHKPLAVAGARGPIGRLFRTDQTKALRPVMSRPTISDWISAVPS